MGGKTKRDDTKDGRDEITELRDRIGKVEDLLLAFAYLVGDMQDNKEVNEMLNGTEKPLLPRKVEVYRANEEVPADDMFVLVFSESGGDAGLWSVAWWDARTNVFRIGGLEIRGVIWWTYLPNNPVDVPQWIER